MFATRRSKAKGEVKGEDKEAVSDIPVDMTGTSATDKKEAKGPASPPGKELKKEVAAPASPAKFTGAVTSKKRLFDGDRKTPISKKTPGTAKLSTALVNAKAVVTGKDKPFSSAGHRFRVAAMPTSCISEVCGFPTTPKDCHSKLQNVQTEDGKFICFESHVHDVFRVIFNFTVKVVDLNDDDAAYEVGITHPNVKAIWPQLAVEDWMAVYDDPEKVNNLFHRVIVGTEINGKVFFYLHEGVIKMNIIVV